MVYVVEDDAAAAASLARLLETVRIAARVCPTAAEFLESYDPLRPSSAVVDVRMPGMSGVLLLEEVRRRGLALPIVVVTAYGDVHTAVRSMKLGAVDFIEKPYDPQLLIEVLQSGLRRDAERLGAMERSRNVVELVSSLTPRERDVLDRILEGKPNKQVAAELGLSQRTVDFHRSRIMQKLNPGSFAGLVRMMESVPRVSEN